MTASILCPHCRAENEPGASQCHNCGAALGAFAADTTLPELTPLAGDSERTTVLSPGIGASPRKAMLVSGHYTHVGQARKVNQDSLLVMEMDTVNVSTPSPLGLYAVADGMGGHKAGEVASGLVVSTIARQARADLYTRYLDGQLTDEAIQQWIKQAVMSANRAVLRQRAENKTDMGSTLVVALVKDTRLFLAHVGDSRAYRLNSDGELERLTHDHSLVEQLIAAKQLTPQQARVHEKRNVIYRTVGEKEELELEQRALDVEPGDRIILCCDGLNGMLEDEQIRDITRAAASPAEAARRLVAAANKAGGEDNITAIVVEVTPL